MTEAELIDAIDVATSAGGIGDIVEIPKGTITISDTIRIAGVRGLRLVGHGRYATVLQWTGDDDRPMFEFDQTAECGLDDVTIDIAAACLEAIRITDTRTNVGHSANSTIGVASTRFRGNDVFIKGNGLLQVGLNNRLGTTDGGKNDQHSFVRWLFQGYTECGVSIEGQAARGVSFHDCQFQGRTTGQYGIRTDKIPGQGGSFFMTGGASVLMQHQIADIILGDRSGPVHVSDAWCEQSARLLLAADYSVQAPAQSEIHPITFSSIRWAGDGAIVPANGRIVDVRSSGPLVFVGCQFGQGASPDHPISIHFEPAFREGGFLVQGCAFNTTSFDGIFSGIYPESTRGSYATTSGQNVTPRALPESQETGRFLPALAEDWVGRGLRVPRSWHMFEEDTILPAWAAPTGYDVNDEVRNANRTYRCVTAGTSAGSGGPTTVSSLITDGSVQWKFIREGEGTVFDRQSRKPRKNLIATAGASLRYDDDSDFAGFLGSLTEVADQQFHYNDQDGSFDPNDHSVLVWARLRIVSSSANRLLYVLGDGTAASGAHGPHVGVDSSERLYISIGNQQVTGSHSYTNEVFEIAIKCDIETPLFLVQTRYPAGTETIDASTELSDAITGINPPGLGNVPRKGWGANSSSASSPVFRIRADAVWLDDAAVANAGAESLADLLERLGGDPAVQAPTAAFTYTDSALLASFTDTSTSPAQISSRAWDFGDGSTSASTNPTHTYAAAGVYSVRLTVTDSNGLIDEVTIAVTIRAVVSPGALTSGSQTTGTGLQYTTASISVGSDRLVLVWVACTAGTSEYPTSVEGCGRNWKRVGEVTWGSSSRSLALFASIGAAGTGALNINFTNAMLSCCWSVVEFSAVNLTAGESGVPAAVRNPTAFTTVGGQTTLIGTLPSFEHVNNVHAYGIGLNSQATVTPGTGFGERHDVNIAANNLTLETADKVNDTSADPTFASAQAGMVCVELVSG